MSNAKVIEFHHAARQFYWVLAIDDKYQDPADEREIPLSEFGVTCEMTAERVNDAFYSRSHGKKKVLIQGQIYRITGFSGFFSGYELSRYFLEPYTFADLIAETKLSEQDLDIPF